jgi:hypothetical protein
VVLRCGTPQELVDEGAGFRLVDPPGFEGLTDGSVAQLVDAVLKDKVLAWVADQDDGSLGLDAKDPCRVVLAFQDGQLPITVRLGGEGEGGVYGVVEGYPEVFSASAALRVLFRRVYVSRAALRVEADAVDSVKVDSHGHDIAVSDPATLRRAAAGLFVDDVVSLGRTTPMPSPLDLEITVSMTEGRAAKRILCGPVHGAVRRCVTLGVPALFEVKASSVARFFASKDAAAD